MNGKRMKNSKLGNGDCFDLLKKMPDNYVHAVVTDPPAGINFMGSKWDNKQGYTPKTKRGEALHSMLSNLQQIAKDENQPLPGDFNELMSFAVFICDVFCEVFRVLKPGGHALVWTLPRTSDLTGIGLRAAGFEVRDDLALFSGSRAAALFGSGFPKSQAVDKAIDKMVDAERKVVGKGRGRTGKAAQPNGSTFSDDKYQWPGDFSITAPSTEDAKTWEGFGSALKPSREDWLLVRKPLEGTIAGNVLKHGTGALNIDACRVAAIRDRTEYGLKSSIRSKVTTYGTPSESADFDASKGRFPTHTLFAHHSTCEECGTRKVTSKNPGNKVLVGADTTPNQYGKYARRSEVGHANEDGTETVPSFSCAAYCQTCNHGFLQNGGSATCPQCNRSASWVCPVAALDESSGHQVSGTAYEPAPKQMERSIYGKTNTLGRVCGFNDAGGAARFFHTFHYYTKPSRKERNAHVTNPHPTVKPISLMLWLVSLVGCQKGSIILDPFMGSGTTGIAAILGGYKFIGIEADEDSFNIAQKRINAAHPGQSIEAYIQGNIPLFGG